MTTGKAKPYYATQELHDTLKRIGNGNQSRGLQIAGGYHDALVEALTLAVDFIEKHPGDPDITKEQVEAWQRLVNCDPAHY